MTNWEPITTAPTDQDILVWYDHDANSYVEDYKTGRLTDYAAWAESGDFMDGRGFCVAKWQEAFWESTDEYGDGYWLPAYWFAKEGGDYERVCHPLYWLPITPPEETP